jgi:hypothetical protein
LDIKSTDRGVLLPRLTVGQIQAISNPANGLIVFCTSYNKFYAYVAIDYTWKEILYGPGIIQPPFVCGASILKYHDSLGGVSPVNKMVTYHTVTNIPGTGSKCWITSNLGADHQATAVNDASEASAGWYWQFNRKQGYKHDGSTLTPGWTITGIQENYDWMMENDPCSIEFNDGWRVPTNSEWSALDANGPWTNWNGPWSSALKIHAAGHLLPWDGSLQDRGSQGDYWSGSQNGASWARYLTFYLTYCYVNSNADKPSGFSIRCIRDY